MNKSLNSTIYAILIIIINILCIDSVTYQLNYEGIVSPRLVLKHAENSRNKNPDDVNARLLPPTIAKETIVTVGTNLFNLWIRKQVSEKKNTWVGKELPLDFNCFPGGSKKCHPQSTICVMDHVGADFSFKINLEIFRADGSWDDYFDASNGATTELNIEDIEKNNSCMNKRVPVSMRVDSIITTADTFARTLLTESVPTINSSIQSLTNPSSVWTIMERPSPLRTAKMFQKDHSKEPIVQADTTNGEELISENKKQNIEKVVLSNHALVSRLPLYSNSLPSIQKKGLKHAGTSTRLHETPSKSMKTDIWQYREAGMDHNTQAVFLNSSLRAISNTAGISHAEAFIHPAMVSHNDAVRVAVISDLPLQYVQQLMKYKYLEHIELIGTDWNAMEASRKYAPSMDDCSDLEGTTNSCMDSPLVKLVRNVSLEDWLNEKLENNDSSEDSSDDNNSSEHSSGSEKESSHFDIIYVDVTVSETERMLSSNLHKKLRKLMTSDSILVVNAGSAPSMDRNYESLASEYIERDRFLERLTSSTEVENGIGYDAAFVYDEETAYPLDSTFIISFHTYGSESYERFTRESDAIIDLDIVHLFRRNMKNSNSLLVYDGATHKRYLRPSRAWEKWFCQMDVWSETSVCEFLDNWFDYSLHNVKTKVERNDIRGRTLVASENIKKGSFINPDDLYYSLRVDSTQWWAFNEFIEKYPDAIMYGQLRDFFLAYGFEAEHLGLSGWAVSLANKNTFTNHACNEGERNVSSMEESLDKNGQAMLFSPAISRRPEVYSQITLALRDIEYGEEIMMDYSVFRDGESKENERFLSFLKNVCATGEGLVKKA